MSRNEEFHRGRLYPHASLDEYLDFAHRSPATATARELLHKAIPADLGLIQNDDGFMFRDPTGQDTPQKVMERKYLSAEQRGIKDDVLARGIINPIRMVPDGAVAPESAYIEAGDDHEWPNVPLIWNGQHRLAVMHYHDPDADIPLDWGSFHDFDTAYELNRRYNTVRPTSERPARLPKRKRKRQ